LDADHLEGRDERLADLLAGSLRIRAQELNRSKSSPRFSR
jgi:hypothetical protein